MCHHCAPKYDALKLKNRVRRAAKREEIVRFYGEQDYDDVRDFLDNVVLPFNGSEKSSLGHLYIVTWVQREDEK